MFLLKVLFAPLSLILSLFVWLCRGCCPARFSFSHKGERCNLFRS